MESPTLCQSATLEDHNTVIASHTAHITSLRQGIACSSIKPLRLLTRCRALARTPDVQRLVGQRGLTVLRAAAQARREAHADAQRRQRAQPQAQRHLRAFLESLRVYI